MVSQKCSCGTFLDEFVDSASSYCRISCPASTAGTRQYIPEQSEGNIRRTGAGRNLEPAKRFCPREMRFWKNDWRIFSYARTRIWVR